MKFDYQDTLNLEIVYLGSNWDAIHSLLPHTIVFYGGYIAPSYSENANVKFRPKNYVAKIREQLQQQLK